MRKFEFKTGAPPLLIAEIGGNHEGDFEKAKELVDSAISSGADVIKLQIYTGDGLVSEIESPKRNKHFKRFELTLDQHIQLAEIVKSAGILYSASIWDFDSLEAMDGWLDFYKIGSGDLTHFPMLDFCVARRKPILLSTGLATREDVDSAVNRLRKGDSYYELPENLCIMQCTSMYPIPTAECNLSVMNTFQALYNCTIGYSDHTEGVMALEVAASMGANVLEFHFTDKKENREFRDHKVSLVESEVKDLKSKINEILIIRGSGAKEPQESERESGHMVSFRRAVYLSKDIDAGELITENDLVYLRPCHGTDVRLYNQVVGSRALRDLKAHAALSKGVDYE